MNFVNNQRRSKIHESITRKVGSTWRKKKKTKIKLKTGSKNFKNWAFWHLKLHVGCENWSKPQEGKISQVCIDFQLEFSIHFGGEQKLMKMNSFYRKISMKLFHFDCNYEKNGMRRKNLREIS
eukprot:Sdes_comp23089_c0_seq1m21412